MRCVVFFAYALEISHTMILMVTGYNVFVKGFGNISGLTAWTSGWAALPVIGSAGEIIRVPLFYLSPSRCLPLVQAIAQSLYAYRIRALRQSVLIPAAIMGVSVFPLASAPSTL